MQPRLRTTVSDPTNVSAERNVPDQPLYFCILYLKNKSRKRDCLWALPSHLGHFPQTAPLGHHWGGYGVEDGQVFILFLELRMVASTFRGSPQPQPERPLSWAPSGEKAATAATQTSPLERQSSPHQQPSHPPPTCGKPSLASVSQHQGGLRH